MKRTRPFVYWATPGGPPVYEMPNSDGRRAIKAFGGYVQIGEYRVAWHEGRSEPWVLSLRGGLGTTRPVEWYQPIEAFTRYADATREARRLMRRR
jgi:hypothetical protein